MEGPVMGKGHTLSMAMMWVYGSRWPVGCTGIDTFNPFASTRP